MCLILNIETATKNCSVSLAKNGKTIAFRNHQEENYSHAEKLHVLMDEILAEANYRLKDLDAIAVSAGPGSYTGLRIGVSSAKGLAYSLDKPLIAVDTLEIMARQMVINDGIIIPIIDARRMEVYTAQFNAHFEKISPTEAIILTEYSFEDINSEIFFIGDCIEKAKSVLNKDKFHFPVKDSHPTAETMSEISFQHFNKNLWVDVAYFEPYYLKEFFLHKKA